MKMGLPGRRNTTLFERMGQMAQRDQRGTDRRLERAHGVHATEEVTRPVAFGRPTDIPTREID